MATHGFLGPLLHEALERELSERGMSFRDLARELQVSPAMFTRMSNGARPDVDAAISMCVWLGRPVEEFAYDRAAADRAAAAVAEFADAEPERVREPLGR